MTVVYQACKLEHRYKKRTILSIERLDIVSGEIFALVGPSGAGKSTLLRLLALLEKPTNGTLNVNLKDRPFNVHTATKNDRRQLTMVFQRPLLLSRSVRANVGFGLRIRGQRNNNQLITQVLERVKLAHLANAHARTLSGGEMQRVAIARALVIQPSVLLLDEPTANLDPYNVRIIEDLIRNQHEQYNTTIVMVTHNVFQAQRLATRVGLMLDGSLIEVAPTQEFFNHPKDPRAAAFVSGDLVY